MTDDGFDEYDLFEAEYADQFDVLDELEGNFFINLRYLVKYRRFSKNKRQR